MAGSLQAQRDYALLQLATLQRQGAELYETLLTGADTANRRLAATSLWQQDCAGAIHQLAGGSKAHWLSRALSDALLVRADDGGAVVEADPKQIVLRIIDVLVRARQSLADIEEVALASSATPRPHRFAFVHNATLRPVLEHALDDSARAFEERDFARSLITSCSILESILTDALEHCGTPIADGGFDQRIAAAEKAGLIRGACRRLPAVARTYRDIDSTVMIVTAREAKVARQVLHVVMRDLNPGR